MRSNFRSGAVAGVPPASGAASAGHPTEDSPATVVGSRWFYAVTQEILTVINQAGITPGDDVDQLKDAILELITTEINNIVVPDGVTLATDNEHLQNNPPGNEAATPRGVRAVRNALLDNVPNAGNTLDKLYDLILLRATLASPTFTGSPRAPTPPERNRLDPARNDCVGTLFFRSRPLP